MPPVTSADATGHLKTPYERLITLVRRLFFVSPWLAVFGDVMCDESTPEVEVDEDQEYDTHVTPEKMADFIVYLSEYGNVSEAARKVHANRTALYRYRKIDGEFATAWDEAEQLGVRGLEDEAKRRAYQGTLKPIFHRGEQCGVIREYSDTLLIFLLKAHDSKYADKQQIAIKDDSGVYSSCLDFSCMSPEQLREQLRLEQEKHADGES